jgi:hypothetical protein
MRAVLLIAALIAARAADPSQSYALYLPSNYSPRWSWPVIFAFSPIARGRVPLERLQEAAESEGVGACAVFFTDSGRVVSFGFRGGGGDLLLDGRQPIPLG